MIKVNKICILINWVREVDMYKNLIRNLPKEKLLILVNDLNHSEIERQNNSKEIVLAIKKEKLKYKFYSKAYKKEKYKVLLSTGESGARKIDIISIFRFIYSRSIGVMLEKTYLSVLLCKVFGRPFTAGELSSKLSRKYYPEKTLGEHVVKYPWSMDLNLKVFPGMEWKKNFDIFFTHGIYDSKLIKKKFKNSKVMIIGYPRYNNLAKKTSLVKKYKKIFKLKKNKKKIFWIPTHVDYSKEIGTNINNWTNKFKILLKYYDIIVRPHTKTTKHYPELVSELRKKGFLVDNKSNRKIGEIFTVADLVFADYGGSVFSSIYLNKPTILLNLPQESKYLLEKEKIQTFDLLVRKKIKSLDPNESSKNILDKCRKISLKNEANQINKLKNIYFGKKNIVTPLREVAKFLLKKLN